MMPHDEYDPIVAFDDFFIGHQARPEPIDYASLARTIAHHVGRRRLSPPQMVVLGSSYDPTYRTFEVADVVYRIIGADDGVRTGLPIFDGLRDRFLLALPSPKMVRLDDEASYAEFRAARREPYIKKLDDKMSAFEEAYENYLEDKDVEIIGAVAEAAHGGTPVPLPLEGCERALQCWRDGKEMLCSARILDNDGNIRIATTGEPLSNSFEEIVGAAMDAEVAPEDMITVCPMVIQLVGATALVPQLCKAVPELLTYAGGDSFVGVMTSAGDPSIAATMALLQRCQQGDRKALGEASVLCEAKPTLLKNAHDQLLRAQSEKAKRS